MSSPNQNAGVDGRIDSFSENDNEPIVSSDWPGEIVVSNEEADLLLSFLGKDVQKLLGE
jgi:hypothetical protein